MSLILKIVNIKFIDISGNNLMSSYDQYYKAIDKNTIALIITHYAGINIPYIRTNNL